MSETDERQRQLLEENLKAIAEQNKRLATESGGIASGEDVAVAVDKVEEMIATELGNSTAAKRIMDSRSERVANDRINVLLDIRSNLYNGTYDPKVIDDIIAEKVTSIGIPEENEKPEKSKAMTDDAIDTVVLTDKSTDDIVTQPSEASELTADDDDRLHDDILATKQLVSQVSKPLAKLNVPDDNSDASGDNEGIPVAEEKSKLVTEAQSESDEEILAEATRDVVEDKDAEPIDMRKLRKKGEPKHAKPKHAKKTKDDGKPHFNPFIAFWHMLVRTIREITNITWPSGKTTVLMTFKVIVGIILISAFVLVLDIGSEHLMRFLYSLQPALP